MTSTPHPFSLRQIQYAIAVADELSFRKAAARCHVSQPSLSAQLGQLEAGLGVRLFERDRRRVLPTGQGRASSPTSRWSLLQRPPEVEKRPGKDQQRAALPLHRLPLLGVQLV